MIWKSSENRIVVDMRQSRSAISWDEVSSWTVGYGKLPDDTYVPKEVLSDYSEFENFVDKNEIYSVGRDLSSSQKYFESEELEPGSYLVAIGLSNNEEDVFAFGASVVNVEAGKTAEADILINRISGGGGSGNVPDPCSFACNNGLWMKNGVETIDGHDAYRGYYFVRENGSLRVYEVFTGDCNSYWLYDVGSCSDPRFEEAEKLKHELFFGNKGILYLEFEMFEENSFRVWINGLDGSEYEVVHDDLLTFDSLKPKGIQKSWIDRQMRFDL